MARVVQARQVWLTVEPRLPHATSIVVVGPGSGETRFVFVSPQPGLCGHFSACLVAAHTANQTKVACDLAMLNNKQSSV
jgi:hypothetical protein